jgi:DNA-binding response OmpR family regulator
VAEPSRNSVMKFDRVLVIDPNPANAKMLANLLRSLGPACQVYGSQTATLGMGLARELNPQLVFVESTGPGLDGMAFARDLRRSEFACREAAMIMVSQEATAALILGARDAGVHEFLRRPYTMGDLQKRIEAVSGRPRDWIEAIQYVGPDRRRFNSADYSGPRKRRTDGSSKSAKINQALKIVQSALIAVESDPVQAARALATQARILIEVSTGQESLKKLGAVAMSLQAYLAGPAQKHGLAREQVETFAHNLMLVAPAETKTRAA